MAVRSKVALLVAAALVLCGRAAPEGEDVDDDQDIEEENLSVEQLQALHAKFDANGDGKVSVKEVMDFAVDMTKVIASKDILGVMEEIDGDKDGRLSLEEHITDISSQADAGDEEEMKELENRKKVEEAKFRAADRNNDGHLDMQEMPGLFYPETSDEVLAVTVADAMQQKDVNKDGKLNAREFWEANEVSGDEGELSEEENRDFARLDLNQDGLIDANELVEWESGRFHTKAAVEKMFEHADKDSDMHMTSAEMVDAKEHIETSDAHYHLIEWAEHHEL